MNHEKGTTMEPMGTYLARSSALEKGLLSLTGLSTFDGP